MEFRTKIPVQKAIFELKHQEQILAIGSCFTENIGLKLMERKFDIQINPFGIVYNPHSIAKSLEKIIASNAFYEKKDVVQYQELWHSFDHHGSFSALSEEEIVEKMNQTLLITRQKWHKTKTLFITFGTAIVYKNTQTNEIVANCHKFPAHYFEKAKLSVDEIVHQYTALIEKLSKDLNIIFTVSPVRHIRDGLVENQRSKATLILAIETLCQRFSQCTYFPAYEIVQDDLRDYRFYANDFIHPNALAIDYIWDIFSQTYFSENTQKINDLVQKISIAAQHRPFNIESKAHQQFIEKQLEKIENLENLYPFLDLSKEKAAFAHQKITL